MKKLVLVLSMLSSIGVFAQEVSNKNYAQTGQDTCINHHNASGLPQLNYGQENNARLESRALKLCRQGYYSYYDPITRVPLFVAQNLGNSSAANSTDVIGDFFKVDTELPLHVPQANLADYYNTGFFPSHLAPSEDMSGNLANENQKNTAINQSLFFTNMMPMVQNNMEKGIWLDLERQVRVWSQGRTNLLVVTGPIFDNIMNPVTIGVNKVWVPTRMYKVLFDPKTSKSIAFVIPNVQVITKKTKALDTGVPYYAQTTESLAYHCGKVCNLNNFITSVEQVENITNLKFFPTSHEVNWKKVDPKAWPIAENQ